MSPSKLHQATNPALISSDISHFTTSDEVKSSMLPFSSPTASNRLSEKSAHPTLEIQGTTNSSDVSVGANATAVAASESLTSATAVHLVRFPLRGCHILTCFHGFALTAPVVARWSKGYSTVLSRDAVAKTFPSAAQAPSQIIRVCDLSTAIAT